MQQARGITSSVSIRMTVCISLFLAGSRTRLHDEA